MYFSPQNSQADITNSAAEMQKDENEEGDTGHLSDEDEAVISDKEEEDDDDEEEDTSAALNDSISGEITLPRKTRYES